MCFRAGIDKMARDLRQRGYDAANFSYQYWKGVADDIVARAKRKDVSYPVIIVGHSLGGNESSKFANYLASRNVKVALVVAFDPVETGRVGPGISEVVNYYLPKKKTDNRILPLDGFTGNISNVDVTSDTTITHTNVEKNPGFQAASYQKITALTTRQSSNRVAGKAKGISYPRNNHRCAGQNYENQKTTCSSSQIQKDMVNTETAVAMTMTEAERPTARSYMAAKI